MTPKPLPAEDIARDVVSGARAMTDDDSATYRSARQVIVGIIEQSRAEGEAGAADELERLRAHIKVLEREQQPRDLAGLVHRYTDLWLDAARADGASERIAGPAADRRRSLAEIVSTLVDAVSDGRLLFAVKTLRSASGEDGDLFDLAARDLAAILREGRVSTSNGPLVLDPPTIRGEPITITGVSVLDEPEDGYTHAVVYYGPGGIAGSALVTAADAARIGDRGRASQQPRDLTGRIRALVQEYAGQWADSDGDARVGRENAMVALQETLSAIRKGGDVQNRILWMKQRSCAFIRQAADELEAIVRDAEEQR